VNNIVAVSGTMTTFAPTSRRNKSAAVVFPPPGPPVNTIRKWFLSEALIVKHTITDSGSLVLGEVSYFAL
jgi:hypothetical protein